MVNRLLLWAAGSSRLEHVVANNGCRSRRCNDSSREHSLSDAVSAAVDLNTAGDRRHPRPSRRGGRGSRRCERGGRAVSGGCGGYRRTWDRLDGLAEAVPAGADRRPCGLRREPDHDPGTGEGARGRRRGRHGAERPGRQPRWTCSGRPSAAIRRPAWPFRRACVARRPIWSRWRR